MARKTQQTQTPKTPTASKPASEETLNGSSTLPADIEIAEGQTVQLGEIVMKAHARSGLSAEAWNALPDDEREALLAKEIEHARSEAVGSAPAPAPAPAPDGAIEAASNGSQAPVEPASKADAKLAQGKPSGANPEPQAVGQSDERIFVALSPVKRNGKRFTKGDRITLDRAGFEELKRFSAVEGEFEDGKSAQA